MESIGDRSSRNRIHIKGLSVVGKIQGKGHRPGDFHAKGFRSHARFPHPETTMIGTNSINPPTALEWIASGKIYPEKVVTDIIPIEKIATDGFDVLGGKSKTSIKILVEP